MRKGSRPHLLIGANPATPKPPIAERVSRFASLLLVLSDFLIGFHAGMHPHAAAAASLFSPTVCPMLTPLTKLVLVRRRLSSALGGLEPAAHRPSSDLRSSCGNKMQAPTCGSAHICVNSAGAGPTNYVRGNCRRGLSQRRTRPWGDWESGALALGEAQLP